MQELRYKFIEVIEYLIVFAKSLGGFYEKIWARLRTKLVGPLPSTEPSATSSRESQIKTQTSSATSSRESQIKSQSIIAEFLMIALCSFD